MKDGVSHPHYELVLDGPVALRADLNHVRHLDQSETGSQTDGDRNISNTEITARAQGWSLLEFQFRDGVTARTPISSINN